MCAILGEEGAGEELRKMKEREGQRRRQQWERKTSEQLRLRRQARDAWVDCEDGKEAEGESEERS